MISKDLLDILACPACSERPPVRLSAAGSWLLCERCGRRYPVKDDIPIMLIDAAEMPESAGPVPERGAAADG